ncbi:hypothetical protein C2S51_017281 [Perilla frutescens var. frutescens]|nr:hypothetical protein C2S51_017281 [Perilla frutescens var. frutescens]
MESESTPPFKISKAHISEQPPCLPEELIEEIFSRLPVKSLLRFRCVSKSWRYLIVSKRFVKKHLDNSTKNASFAHHRIILNSIEPQRGLKQCSFRSMLSDPFTDQFTFCDSINNDIRLASICVAGCCNGLVCILLDGKHFMLWNPSTRMSKKLPAMDHKINRGHITNYGFGFDDLSGDYKVFGIASFFWITGKYEAICKVYSLQTNSWKIVKKGNVSPFDKEGKFASGKLHWNRTLGLYWNIVSFDLRSEVCGAVELPSCFSDHGFYGSMGVLGGCLSMLCDYKSRLDMWVMKQYGVKESWDKVVTVPYLHNPERSSFSALFAIGPNGEVLLTYGSTFVIYYPEDNGFRHCQVTDLDIFREPNIYVESLVSVIPYSERDV